MSITRAPRPTSNFYLLDKKISEDKRLSWAARGILIFLLGKPDYWTVSPAALTNETKGLKRGTGRDGVYAILKELADVGYLQIADDRDASGSFAGTNYTVSETPVLATIPHADLPDTAGPDTAEPDTANPTQVSIEGKKGLKGKQVLKEEGADAPAPRTERAGLEMPDGMHPQAWADFLTMRKAKRATLTATALAGIEREAVKAGVSLNTAIAACCEYGWQGFSATWYAERQALTAPAYGAPAAQRPQPSRYQPAPPRYAGAGAAIFGNQNQNFDDGRTFDAQ